jgi:hypothetical protein
VFVAECPFRNRKSDEAVRQIVGARIARFEPGRSPASGCLHWSSSFRIEAPIRPKDVEPRAPVSADVLDILL